MTQQNWFQSLKGILVDFNPNPHTALHPPKAPFQSLKGILVDFNEGKIICSADSIRFNP